ncbi:TPA: ROK family protein, partial [Bacillus cereus]
MPQYVVIDIGGTTIKHSVMNHEAEFLKTGVTTTPKQGGNGIFNCLLDIVNYYKKSFLIKGVALSVPGAVNPEDGYVYFAGAVTDLTNRSLKKELSILNLPIELENDANCATLAEKWRGNATQCESFVCITAGTGIGGGIFINGDLYRGEKGM